MEINQIYWESWMCWFSSNINDPLYYISFYSSTLFIIGICSALELILFATEFNFWSYYSFCSSEMMLNFEIFELGWLFWAGFNDSVFFIWGMRLDFLYIAGCSGGLIFFSLTLFMLLFITLGSGSYAKNAYVFDRFISLTCAPIFELELG